PRDASARESLRHLGRPDRVDRRARPALLRPDRGGVRALRRGGGGDLRRVPRLDSRGARGRGARNHVRAAVARMSALWELGLAEAAALIAAGELARSDLVASVLERIDEVEPLVRAFVSVDAEGALRAARAQDGATGGTLRGIPVAIKDIFDVEGFPTGCGSDAYEDAAVAIADAAAVARLRSAGAVVVGKTTTHELACGVYTAPTRNPWDLERSAGGSSGGSGAAVAAGAALGAIGSDTGGSIRIPASHCGLVGVKPTYDLVPRGGALTLSWSLDHVGPLARSVDDVALLLAVLAGREP